MNATRILRFLGGAGLAALLLAAPAAAQTPAAGTRIGNQAVATYTDGSGVQRVVTSNLVETVITQVAAVAIDAPNTLFGTVGSQVVFGHQVTNNGNGPDFFLLALTDRPIGGGAGQDDFDYVNLAAYADANGDGVPDDLTSPITQTPTLQPGETFTFVVAGSIPAGASVGDSGEVEVLAQSNFDAGVDTGAVNTTVGNPGTDLDTATVTNQGVVEITKSMSSQSGPDDGTTLVTVRIDYGNTGIATATNVVIRDILPTAAVGGLDYQANSGNWSVGGALTDAAGGDPAGINYEATIVAGAGDTIQATIASVPPSTTGFITFQFTVESPTTSGTLINQAELQYDDGSGTIIPGAGLFQPSNPVPYTIADRPGVTINPDPNTVPSAPQGGTVTWTNVVQNTGNETDTMDITLSGSTFPAGTIFTLYKSDGVSLLLDTNGTGIPDTGPMAPNALYNVVLQAQLPTGATGGPFQVTKNAQTENVDGSNNPATDTNDDVLTAIVAGQVDITNDVSVDDGGGGVAAVAGDGLGTGPEPTPVRTQTGDPGETVTFNLIANLLTDPADTFDIEAFSDAALTIPYPWPVVFRDRNGANVGNTGPLVNGSVNNDEIDGGADGPDEKLIVASVTIPAGTAPGDNDIFFRILSPTTNVTDAIRDRVTVNTVRDVRLSPDNLQGQTFPGGTIDYAHILENFGNATEGSGDGVDSDIFLNYSDSNNPPFTTVLYWDADDDGVLDPLEAANPILTGTAMHTIVFAPGLSDGLAPGERQRFFVRVNAALGATAGDSNETVLTADVSDAAGPFVGGGAAVPDPTDPSVTDQTVVVAGDLELTKLQALDAACDGTPDTAYGPATITAEPNQCVRYLLTLTNTGAVDATFVTLSDSTPAFTQLDDGDAAVGATGFPSYRVNTGAFVAVTTQPPAYFPGPGVTTGEVSHSVGTLSPSDVAELYFGVRVEP